MNKVEKFIIESNGVKKWYKNDKLHRDSGPAIEYPDGAKYWVIKKEEEKEDIKEGTT